jgi:hypothetical protein
MWMREDGQPKIDDDINDVARSLTSGAPSAAFRASVRARLDASTPRVGLRAAGYVGAAAAAAIVIAFVSWPPNRELPPSADVGRALSGTPGEPNKVRPTTASDLGRALSPVDDARGNPEYVGRALSGPPPGEPATAERLPASTEEAVDVDLLDVMPLDVEPLEIPMIAVDALVVDPLVIQQ